MATRTKRVDDAAARKRRETADRVADEVYKYRSRDSWEVNVLNNAKALVRAYESDVNVALHERRLTQAVVALFAREAHLRKRFREVMRLESGADR